MRVKNLSFQNTVINKTKQTNIESQNKVTLIAVNSVVELSQR